MPTSLQNLDEQCFTQNQPKKESYNFSPVHFPSYFRHKGKSCPLFPSYWSNIPTLSLFPNFLSERSHIHILPGNRTNYPNSQATIGPESTKYSSISRTDF